MARPKKIGLDYFPFDVDFFDDDKIGLIEAEFGSRGLLVTLRLLCKIYKNGYYYQWGGDECLLLTRQLGAGFVPKMVEEVVAGLVRRAFFDKGVYDSFRILTSRGIQRRYMEATRDRQGIEVSPDWWLLDVYPGKTPVSSRETQVSSREKPQIKVKKSKIKKTLSVSPSFQSGEESTPALPAETEREIFYRIFFLKNFRNPLSEVERFIAFYQATGWQRRGERVIDRTALARSWTEEKGAQGAPPLPPRFIEWWGAIYNTLAAQADCGPMFHDLRAVEITPKRQVILIMRTPDGGLRDFIEQHVETVQPLLNRFFPEHTLHYRVPRV